MSNLIARITSTAKAAAKFVAQQTLGRLPSPASRLEGRLKTEGGRPVRDTRLRPWPQASWQNRGGLARLLTLRSNLWRVWLSGTEGLPQPLAQEFGRRWAEFCGCRFALLLPHGTDALRLGLAAALDHDGLDYGGEVIVPNVSFIASATALLDRRFGVCFVDVDPDTLLLDPRRVEEAIVPGKTRAIMAVHLFGQPADMRALREIAARHGLKLIEDAAQAHGAELDLGRAGSLGDAGGFSFQTYKNLSCGEGGALTTSDEALFDRAWMMHNAGRSRAGTGRWEHLSLGWNCRPTEYQAALLLDRLGRLDRQQEHRRRNFTYLAGLLADVACLRPLAVRPDVRRHGAHMFTLRYRPEHCGGLDVGKFLEAAGAEGAPVWRSYTATMMQQPAMIRLSERRPEYVRALATPVSDAAVRDLIYVPQSALLAGRRDMEEIAAALRKVWRRLGVG